MGGAASAMKAVVTGGGGFIGAAIVRLLRERGDDVTIVARGHYPELERLGVRAVRADLDASDSLPAAFDGADVVFHVAALAGIWGRRRDFWRTNVEGTRNVLAACRAAGVPRLVYTSSPSVVFGEESLRGVDEAQPYPKRYHADYPETKAIAERMVLQANGPSLATVAIRPHLVWGPGDPHLIPRIVARARAGRLRRIGDGRNLVDITYIDNAAWAHVLAADALRPEAACAGRAYFISQGDPVNLWAWLGELLARLGEPPVRGSLSHAAARAAGTLLEWLYRLLPLSGEPRMTRFLAGQLAKSHYFCIEAARRDFGYRPLVSTSEGMARLVSSWNGGQGVVVAREGITGSLPVASDVGSVCVTSGVPGRPTPGDGS